MDAYVALVWSFAEPVAGLIGWLWLTYRAVTWLWSFRSKPSSEPPPRSPYGNHPAEPMGDCEHCRAKQDDGHNT